MGSKLAELQAAVKCLKAGMKEVERELKEVPFDVPILQIRQMNVDQSWHEVCWYYKGLGTLTLRQRAKVEFIASGKLQAQYEELNARVDKAIKDYNLDEVGGSAVSSASGDLIPKKKPKKKNLLREAIKA